MYTVTTGGGCIFPIQPPVCYGILLTEDEEALPILELISKEKDGFGDIFYCIRDQSGVINQVYEGNLEEFMKRNGVSVLKEGSPFMYPRKSKR